MADAEVVSTTTGTEDQIAASKDKAIANLLEICAVNNIAINEHLRRAILGEELYNEAEIKSIRPETLNRRQSVLSELVKAQSDIKTSYTETAIAKEVRDKLHRAQTQQYSFEVRIRDGKYTVESEASGKQYNIPTVANQGCFYNLGHAINRCIETGSCAKAKMETKSIISGVNLFLEEGKMYLILGAPGSGKSSLLKMIAGLLPEDDERSVSGTVEVNGVDSRDKNIVWSNLVSYVDQIDRLYGYLTVKETLEFAFNCRYGGTHRGPFYGEGEDVDKLIGELDAEGWMVDIIMRSVGLKRVADTFVGNDKVRGVSGGEKKRVTVAEMMATGTFVDCYDEISTGLDAATTFDICKVLSEVTRMRKKVLLVSLLQPPPETVALFDEVILLDEGKVLYAGPVDEVTNHFKSLGYEQPERMDPADWLQSLPTKDGAQFLKKTGEEVAHLTNKEFVEKYNESGRAQETLRKLESEESNCTALDSVMFMKRYANSTIDSVKVVFGRELKLWWRDKYARTARLMQDLLMGLIVGTVFWQTPDVSSRMGVVFQSVFFISMGAMLKVAPQIDTRGIFYKEQDANFFPTWTFVLARSLAGLPTSLQDALVYGSIVYWCSGFTFAAANYLVFLLLTLLCAFTCGLLFSIFSATIKDRPTAQAAMSIALVIMVLFSGFTVQPDVIPAYYIWIYWMNLFAWVIRAVVINEYKSEEFSQESNESGFTEGDVVLQQLGFVFRDDEPFEYVWVWWTVLFCVGLCFVSIAASVWSLNNVKFQTGGSLQQSGSESEDTKPSAEDGSRSDSSLESKGATMTFTDVNYKVTSSITNEELHLLNGVSGYFAKGKMTALMGSSGAGK